MSTKKIACSTILFPVCIIMLFRLVFILVACYGAVVIAVCLVAVASVPVDVHVTVAVLFFVFGLRCPMNYLFFV